MTNYLSSRILLLCLALALVIYPFLTDSFSTWQLANRVLFFLLLVLSWNLISGFAGIFSFGHVAFAAIGAYTSAILAGDAQAPIVLSMMAGGLAAAVGGLLLGLLGHRISGPYLVVVSFAFLRMVQIVIQAQTDLTGGVSGMSVPPLVTGENALQITFLIGLGLVIAYLVGQRVVLHSHLRFYLTALKDNPYAAEAMGGNPRRWKVALFAVSAGVAGISGAYFGHSSGFITPNIGGLTVMALVVAMGMIGGLGTTVGPIAATILILLVDDRLRATTGGLSTFIFGIVLIVVILLAPGGLSGLGRSFERLVHRRNAPAITEGYGPAATASVPSVTGERE